MLPEIDMFVRCQIIRLYFREIAHILQALHLPLRRRRRAFGRLWSNIPAPYRSRHLGDNFATLALPGARLTKSLTLVNPRCYGFARQGGKSPLKRGDPLGRGYNGWHSREHFDTPRAAAAGEILYKTGDFALNCAFDWRSSWSIARLL